MVADFKEAFSVFDVDKVGSITAGQLRQLLAAAGMELPSPAPGSPPGSCELLDLVNSVVGDIVGEQVSDTTPLTFPQFVQLMANLVPPGKSFEDEVDAVFDTMAAGADAVSADHLASTAALIGDAVPDIDELNDVVAAVDPATGNAVSRDAFRALMQHS